MTATLVHGTHNAYSNYHCRCDQCRAFRNRYERQRLTRRVTKTVRTSLKRATDTYPRRP